MTCACGVACVCGARAASTPETRWPPGRIECGGRRAAGADGCVGERAARRDDGRWRSEREATTHTQDNGRKSIIVSPISLSLSLSRCPSLFITSAPPRHRRPCTCTRIGVYGSRICVYTLNVQRDLSAVPLPLPPLAAGVRGRGSLTHTYAAKTLTLHICVRRPVTITICFIVHHLAFHCYVYNDSAYITIVNADHIIIRIH